MVSALFRVPPLLVAAVVHLGAAMVLLGGAGSPHLPAALGPWLLAAAALLFLHRSPVGGLAAAALLGVLLALLRQAPPEGLPLGAAASRPAAMEARLRRWQETEDGAWAMVDHLADATGTAFAPRSHKLLVELARASPPLRAGDRVSLRGRWQHDGRHWRLEDAWMVRLSRGPPGHPLAMRQAVRDRLQEVLPPDDAGLATALLLGDRGRLDAAWADRYRRLGLVHLLAVSGLHLWCWDLLLTRLLRGRARALRWPLLLGIVLLADAAAPILRAATALALRDLAAAGGWRLPALRLWTLAWAAECLLSGPGRDHLGLLLSYGATFFLLVGAGPPRAPAWKRVPRASIAAFLGGVPLLHARFGTVEPWSIPLSPLLALLLPPRLLGAALALLPGGATPARLLFAACRELEEMVLGILGPVPAAPWVLPRHSSLALAVACVLGLLLLSGRMRPRARVGVALLLPFLLLPQPTRPGILLVDAGHGLAVVVAGRERSLLFDCGSRSMSAEELIDRRLLPGLRHGPFPIPDRLLLSHADDDHVNALPLLRKRLPLTETTVPAGGWRPLPDLAPWRVRALGMRGERHEVRNDGGHALELMHGSRRVLLLGDQEGWSLRRLLELTAPGPIDLLLLPHHGLSTAGLAELLLHLQPRETWVSCGAEDLPLPVGALMEQLRIPMHTTLTGPLTWFPLEEVP
ncbi:MAG: ComEC/Rec2 family competence protein [Planctomycetota bacterium]